jgi:uncharacterized protein GlcG (DUF336 family)
MSISSKSAERAIDAARQTSVRIGVPMNIAILDGSGHLKAFLRMDGAMLGSVDIALKKAKTAFLLGMNTEAVFEFCKPGAPAFGLEHTNGGLVVFAGGIPLKADTGETIGAVGVSGGTVSEDFGVAQAAAAALTN